MGKTVKVGVVGCGNISPIYLKNGKKFEILDIVACADLIPERAESRAAEFGVPRVCTTEELLADPEIQIVLNITTPNSHAEVAFAALEANKCVYNEKPLAIRREDGQRLLEIAKEKGLLVGGAPDTFLGGGIQTYDPKALCFQRFNELRHIGNATDLNMRCGPRACLDHCCADACAAMPG